MKRSSHIVAHGVEYWMAGRLEDVIPMAWRSLDRLDAMVGIGAENNARRHVIMGPPIVAGSLATAYVGYEILDWITQ